MKLQREVVTVVFVSAMLASLHGPKVPGQSTGACRHTNPEKLRLCRPCKAFADPSASRAEVPSVDAPGAAKCPFSQLKELAKGPQPRTLGDGAQSEGVPIPGPSPLSLNSLLDVGSIFYEGLHAAQLRFSRNYGPICR